MIEMEPHLSEAIEADGKLEVSKIAGDKNPADLMTKILGTSEVAARLSWLNLDFVS